MDEVAGSGSLQSQVNDKGCPKEISYQEMKRVVVLTFLKVVEEEWVTCG